LFLICRVSHIIFDAKRFVGVFLGSTAGTTIPVSSTTVAETTTSTSQSPSGKTASQQLE
jgi:hypothetical protein